MLLWREGLQVRECLRTGEVGPSQEREKYDCEYSQHPKTFASQFFYLSQNLLCRRQTAAVSVPLFVLVQQCERVFTWEEYRYTSSFRWPGRDALLLMPARMRAKWV